MTHVEEEAFIEEMKKTKPREIWLELWQARKKLEGLEPENQDLTPDDADLDVYYENGQTIRFLEYGVKYPNGTVRWGYRYDTAEQRDEVIKEWEYDLRRLRLDPDSIPRPTFLVRTQTKTFTDVKDLA